MEETKKKVLVIDDEKVIRDFLKRFLTLEHLDVTDVESGIKAIELSKKTTFDIYFIDVRMPELDGMATYKQIHSINPLATIIMMSGYAVDNVIEQIRKEGFCHFIHKPFDMNQIKEIIGKINPK